MARWILGGLAIIALGVMATIYFGWVQPTGNLLEQTVERLESLEDALPERWAVPAALAPSGSGNLVPTEAELATLDQLLGRPMRELGSDGQLDGVVSWKRGMGEPSAELVRAIRENARLATALDDLAVGDHGTATDATGERLDEAILWMVARAWAARDEECFTTALDAVRVAQAIQPLERRITDRMAPYGACEAEALHSIEAPWVACGARADPSERRRAIEALETLDRERPFPVSRRFLIERVQMRVEELEDRRDEELPFVSAGWEEQRAEVEARLDEIELYVRYDQPFDELYPYLHAHGVARDHPHELSDWTHRDFQIRVESRLLRAVLLHQNGESVAGLDDSHFRYEHRPADDDGWPERILALGTEMACDSMFDSQVALEPHGDGVPGG